MGAFYLIDEPHTQQADRLREQVERAYASQGFPAPLRLKFGSRQLGFYGKFCGTPPQVYRHDDGAFCALSGTAIVAGHRGEAAVRSLVALAPRLLNTESPDWSDVIGQFAVVHSDARTLSLFLDPMGIFKAYRRSDGRVYASSFLAVAATVDAPTLRTQAVYEYLFQEATYGGDTVLAEVELVRHGGVYRFDHDSTEPPTFTRWHRSLPLEVTTAPLDEHVEACVARLRFVFQRIGEAFGDDVDTALSGGYDSRLIVALLQEQGVDAGLHVYGASDAPDVTVAQQVAHSEGLRLEHIDKSTFAMPAPEEFANVVAANYHAFDGYPPAGILDAGGDRATRSERSARGRLMLNGGGGEVFRNFFYLPAGRYRTRDVVHTFYSRFDPGFTTAVFDETRYVARLAEKIGDAVDGGGGVLSRVQVERVYPEFRCCYWMGRNNAINSRFGFALTPFIDPVLHPLTLRVPLDLKNHGRLEARMIAAVSPSLARHRSDYGHAFDVAPPLARVLKDYMTLLRPPRLRRLMYRIRHRRMTMQSRFLEPRYLARIVDPSLPRVSRFLDIDKVNDAQLLHRACTLEYLCQRLDASIAESD